LAGDPERLYKAREAESGQHLSRELLPAPDCTLGSVEAFRIISRQKSRPPAAAPRLNALVRGFAAKDNADFDRHRRISVVSPPASSEADPKLVAVAQAEDRIKLQEESKMRYKLFLLALAAASMLTCVGTAAAQRIDRGERRELQADRREVRADTRDIRSDRRDIRGDVREWTGDVRELRQDKREGASQAEIRADRQEIKGDTQDIRSDRRDIHRDYRDRRGDVRDFRQDRREARRN